MNALIGLLWALGGAVLGFGLLASGASAWARFARVSKREGAIGYFVIGLGMFGGVLGLAAGLAWHARSAPPGQGWLQLGQGVLGLAAFAVVLAVAAWAWVQTREVPVRYEGNTQASLLLQFRMAAAAAPEGEARQWLKVDVNTAHTRPPALVLQDEVRQQGSQLVVPAIQGPLVRARRRLIVARLMLPGGERHEVFMPRMRRKPDPRADWSDWVSPRVVFDVRTETEGGAALLQMRWRLRLYGE